MSSEEALKAEIARLSGAINQHKATGRGAATSTPYLSARNKTYVNPNYKLPSSGPHRTNYASQQPTHAYSHSRPPSSAGAREVVIDGVAFQSSNSKLVRKELTKPSVTKPQYNPSVPHHSKYAKKFPGARSHHRPYRPRPSRKPQNNNMTLENGRRPVRMGRKTKSVKTIDRQCPRFSTTGICTKGHTCLYKHDPAKIAICWPFLNGKCTNSASSCSLSHEPTPERTPLCVHFANNGRCKNGERCLFPHVRVGPRNGVCRNFAVLGYCEKGVDCDQAHVRECPDFAEKGSCPNRRCKLPHVIRASQRRAETATQSATSPPPPSTNASEEVSASEIIYGDDANIGDEFISLTFHESESDEEGDEEESDGSDDGSEEESESRGEEMEVYA